MGFEPNSITEKRIKALLCVILVFLIFVTLVGAWSYSKINFVEKSDTDMSLREPRVSDTPENLKQIDGRIIFMSPDGTFIRVSATDGNIYSVSLNSETKIMEEGTAITLSNISPASTIVVTALELSNTEQFDFRAASIEIIPTPTLTVEERIKELSESGVGESVDF